MIFSEVGIWLFLLAEAMLFICSSKESGICQQNKELTIT